MENTKETGEVTASTEVFNLPEIRDQILLNLPPADLLQVQQVNRAFFNAIETSQLLRQAMMLEQDNSHRFLDRRIRKVVHFTKLRIRIPAPELLDEFSIRLIADLSEETVRREPAPTGKRVRQIFLRQPPVRALAIETRRALNCCDEHTSKGNEGVISLFNPNGLRVQAVLQAMVPLRALLNSRSCPKREELGMGSWHLTLKDNRQLGAFEGTPSGLQKSGWEVIDGGSFMLVEGFGKKR